MIRKWLTRLALWVLRCYNIPTMYPVYFARATPYLTDARALTKAGEVGPPKPGNGEYKRHVVYARLIKAFPTAHRRDLALAIELALE